MSGRVLLVDDDPTVLRLVGADLRREGIETVEAATGAEALRRMGEEPLSAVVLDLGLPDVPGKELLARMRREHPGVPVVVLTAADRIVDVVECMRLGATDYVPKAPEPTRLVASVRNAMERGALQARVESLAHELRRGEGFGALLGASPALRKSTDLLRRAAASEVTVLLEGESGTGKEVAARAIHAEGGRRTGPFVAVNCGAIPEGLVESELFGHERGAFTGAVAARKGRFEEADGGTIFLDEIGELRIDLQVKLLRVLQELKVQRVGGTGERSVDVRVVAATNRDLRALLAAGTFREDLYYRLSVFPVRLPPLREREGDAALLAGEFLRRFGDRHRRAVGGFSAEASRALEAYSWPGNVRELENVVERAVLMEDAPQVSLGSLPDSVVDALHATAGGGPARSDAGRPAAPGAGPAAKTADIRPLEDEERLIILRALDATAWNIQEAATRLGISRATIYRKIERYGIAPGAVRAALPGAGGEA
jgi:DNA-binding NtrC family response regulator